MRFFLLLVILCMPGAASAATPLSHALFAGGNFWAVQEVFDQTAGVDHTIAGYTGGIIANPSYLQVSRGDTGHRQAVMVFFDPRIVSYESLLATYWHNIDPMNGEGQFCDKGFAFTPAIYYEGVTQQYAALQSKSLIEADSARMGDKRAAVQILPAGAFYPAESHHQRYYEKNPLRYRFYVSRCGRSQRLFDLWGREAQDGN